MTEQALFVRDGDALVATEFARGGWDPRHASGGSTLALLGHCLAGVPAPVPMTLSRLTADLVRPLPLGRPLTVATTVAREGENLQLVDAHVLGDGELLARAAVLRLRDADLSGSADVPTGADVPTSPPLPPPHSVPSVYDTVGGAVQVPRSVDLRYAPTQDGGQGVWVRLDTSVVAGEPVHQVSRMALTFDYANNINVPWDGRAATTINPDVNAHVLRQACGEWMAVTGHTRYVPALGRGVSTAEVSDLGGTFAVVTVSQLVQPRNR